MVGDQVVRLLRILSHEVPGAVAEWDRQTHRASVVILIPIGGRESPSCCDLLVVGPDVDCCDGLVTIGNDSLYPGTDGSVILQTVPMHHKLQPTWLDSSQETHLLLSKVPLYSPVY